jgi:uncharacterized membrane protein YgcG
MLSTHYVNLPLRLLKRLARFLVCATGDDAPPSTTVRQGTPVSASAGGGGGRGGDEGGDEGGGGGGGGSRGEGGRDSCVSLTATQG